MTTIAKLSKLKHIHFEHRLWNSELVTVQQEIDFFLKYLDFLKIETLGNSKQALAVAEFNNQFRHFERLVKRLITDLNGVKKEVAEGFLHDNVLDKEQTLDHKYLSEDMKYFESDYYDTKKSFKKFVQSLDLYE